MIYVSSQLCPGEFAPEYAYRKVGPIVTTCTGEKCYRHVSGLLTLLTGFIPAIGFLLAWVTHADYGQELGSGLLFSDYS
ncbi:hypothetical protein BDV37DRAFT_57843 [Aspergillus pseudonomiae]|uniref:Uncharacterized protein n=1 Tax=Aspergillus pseudonomiae TaxID=1506151 RepID=A0A5N7DM20_9EURO|nr:uncharacterized protein BDV37DRAFT_57843 [Aspergillus pseudonomiae]KAE8406528.1 hypothetical protein BDV37DRAFT_57843 [Aspergillus pseudonomiae]